MMFAEKVKNLLNINKDANVHDKGVMDHLVESNKHKIKKEDLIDLMGMSYARFSNLLPYRYYDKEDNLFINEQSIGFALELSPLTGSNQDITKALSEMIKNKISPQWTAQLMLVASSRIEHTIDYLKRKSGDDVFDELRFNQYQFVNYAAKHGFPNKRNIDSPCRDYRLFLFINKRTNYNEHEAALCEELRSELTMELKNAMIHSIQMDTEDFVSLVKSIINQDDQSSYPQFKVDKYKEINEQIIDPTWSLKVNDNHLDVGIDRGTKRVEKCITTLSLKQLPGEAVLGAMPDNFANILKTNMGIPCDFIISVHFKTNEQEMSKRSAFNKSRGLEKKAQSPYAKMIPGVVKAAAEWKKIRQELDSDEISLVRMYYAVTLFTDKQTLKQDISKTISAFRVNGMDLYTIKYQQLQSFMSVLPFVVGEGLWSDLAILGRINKITSWNLTNMLPLVADYKGEMNGQGLIAPTFRHQIANIDLFSSNAQNYNCCICATSGSGKSVLAQSIISSVLADAGKVFVIDIGNSYKKFCETLGGTYMDVSNLKLNPFSHVTNIGESAESIRDLLAIMAAPNSGITDVQKAHLLTAVRYAFDKKGQETKIDDVVEYLKDNGGDQRVFDLATLLSKYTSTADSISARIFNQPSMLTSDDPRKERFIVLELGGLNDQPDLLKSVLFALILNIEQAMYHSDRSRKKLCVIDEAWSLLSGGNETAARAIEKGYRTARRHKGSWCAITQGIDDFFASAEAKAAFNSSDNKIIMRQDPKSFKTFLQNNEGYFNPYESQLINNFKPSSVSGYSEFLFQQGANSTFHRLYLDPVSKILYSSKADEYQYVKNKIEAGASVQEAIMDGANHFFGHELRRIESAQTTIEDVEAYA